MKDGTEEKGKRRIEEGAAEVIAGQGRARITALLSRLHILIIPLGMHTATGPGPAPRKATTEGGIVTEIGTETGKGIDTTKGREIPGKEREKKTPE